MNKDNNHQWAQFHAAAGMPVFPCHAGGPKAKAPLIPDDFKSASRDPAVIASWWTQHPGAAVGAALHNGIVVIDLDVKPDQGIDGVVSLRTKIGEETLLALFKQSIVVRTPSGGWHLYVAPQCRDCWRNQTHTNGLLGVDLRVGGHGYTIAPGTVMADGGVYQCWG